MQSVVKILSASFTLISILGAGYLAMLARDMSTFDIPEPVNYSRHPSAESENDAVTGETVDPLEPKEGIPEDAVLVALEDIFINIGRGDAPNKTLGMKLQVELFDDGESKTLFEHNKGPVKDVILQTVVGMDEAMLTTLSGKLYLKEQMIRKINEFLLSAVVRDIHYESYLIQ